MKKAYKLIVGILVLVSVFALCSCGGSETKEAPEPSSDASVVMIGNESGEVLMEHVDAKAGDNTCEIYISGVKDGERYFIEIDKDDEYIGTTERIVANGAIPAYLNGDIVFEKNIFYTAKLYKFRENEASKSDFVASLGFNAQ